MSIVSRKIGAPAFEREVVADARQQSLSHGRGQRRDDDGAADVGELVEQLALVLVVERRELHHAREHLRPVGQEVVQREHHDHQAEQQLENDLQRR